MKKKVLTPWHPPFPRSPLLPAELYQESLGLMLPGLRPVSFI
jgi:hypothetical protein